MKALKPRAVPRPSPAEALRIATEVAPSHPPAVLPPQPQAAAPATADRTTTLNLRVRGATLSALAGVARERGLTLKQVVCHALADAGVAVAPEDLEDRTPRRRA